MFEALLSLQNITSPSSASPPSEAAGFDRLSKAYHLRMDVEGKERSDTPHGTTTTMTMTRTDAIAWQGLQHGFPSPGEEEDANKGTERLYYSSLALHLLPFLPTPRRRRPTIENPSASSPAPVLALSVESLRENSALLNTLLLPTNTTTNSIIPPPQQTVTAVVDRPPPRRSPSPLPTHTKNSFSISFKRNRSPPPLASPLSNLEEGEVITVRSKEEVGDVEEVTFVREEKGKELLPPPPPSTSTTTTRGSESDPVVEKFKSMFSPYASEPHRNQHHHPHHNNNNNKPVELYSATSVPPPYSNDSSRPPPPQAPFTYMGQHPQLEAYNSRQQHYHQHQDHSINDRFASNRRAPAAAPRRAPPYEYNETNNNNNNNTNSGFVSAGEQLANDVKTGKTSVAALGGLPNHTKPNLGLRRNGFQPPFRSNDNNNNNSNNNNDVNGMVSKAAFGGNKTANPNSVKSSPEEDFPPTLLLPDGTVPPSLAEMEVPLLRRVAAEMLEGAGSREIGWEDIAGLQDAKASIEEAIVWPLRRPDLFVGLRDPPRGLLLFGPPGTGKTMIARAIANRAECTFINISASSLMSKWLGEGEQLVRVLFAIAAVKQPAVIFIDEVDSLLSARGEGEMDSVRRVKTEFLVQMDGVGTDRGERVLLIGATNRPEELDEAARRRMEKRLYIPLPDHSGRRTLIARLLHVLETSTAEVNPNAATSSIHSLSEEDLDTLASRSEGYSGADLKILCKDAAMGPVREAAKKGLSEIKAGELRPIAMKDFTQALRRLKPSVGSSEVVRYEEWNKLFGSFSAEGEGEDEDEEDED